jgi:hypothetical protein
MKTLTNYAIFFKARLRSQDQFLSVWRIQEVKSAVIKKPPKAAST